MEREKLNSSIYIMVDTLSYLKKGGSVHAGGCGDRDTLKLKPVLQIQGEKLDAFAKARTVKQAKSLMIDAMKNDFENRFMDPAGEHMYLEMAYTYDRAAAEAFYAEVRGSFSGHGDCDESAVIERVVPHSFQGALAIACSRKIPELEE